MKGKISFEAAVEELALIVEKLEAGEASLEDSLKLFEKGAKLASQCYTVLQNAEQKITELSKLEAEAAKNGGNAHAE